MKAIGVLVLLCCFTTGHAQKQAKAQTAFDAALKLSTEEKLSESLEAFESFMNVYHWSSLVPRAHFNVGYLSMELKDYAKAKRTFNEILESDYDEMETNDIMEPYTLYKHWSARHLAEISLDLEEWNEAERYIGLFLKQYPYQHFCGNEWEAYDIYKATIYARLHEGQGKAEQAMADVIRYIFPNFLTSNEPAKAAVIGILTRHYSSDAIAMQLKEALEGDRDYQELETIVGKHPVFSKFLKN